MVRLSPKQRIHVSGFRLSGCSSAAYDLCVAMGGGGSESGWGLELEYHGYKR